MFESKRAYNIAFTVYLLCLLAMIYETVKATPMPLGYSAPRSSFTKMLAAITCLVFFMSVLNRSSDALEKSVLILSSLFFLLWASDSAAASGYQWAYIPNNLMISTIILAFATAIVGLRAIQVHLTP